MEISSFIGRAALGQPNDLQTHRRSQASDGTERWLSLLFFATVILTTIPQAQSSTPIKIIPHKAAYVFEMESADPGSGVEDIGGGMTFEWADACDGWALKQHYFLRISTIEGTGVDISTSTLPGKLKTAYGIASFFAVAATGSSSRISREWQSSPFAVGQEV